MYSEPFRQEPKPSKNENRCPHCGQQRKETDETKEEEFEQKIDESLPRIRVVRGVSGPI